MNADKETNREWIRLRKAFGATGRRMDTNRDKLHRGGPEGDCKISKGKLSPSSVSVSVNKDFIRVYSCPFAVSLLSAYICVNLRLGFCSCRFVV